MASWDHGAKTLKYFFREVCHGEIPLNMDRQNEGSHEMSVDPDAQSFLSNLSATIASLRMQIPLRDGKSKINTRSAASAPNPYEWREPEEISLSWVLDLFSS